MGELVTLGQGIKSEFEYMRNTNSAILNEVVGIHDDTSAINGKLTKMESGISEIKSSVGTIVTRGVNAL